MNDFTDRHAAPAPASSEDSWEVMRHGSVIATGEGLERLHAAVRKALQSLQREPAYAGRNILHAVYLHRVGFAGAARRVYIIDAADADLARVDALVAGIGDGFYLTFDDKASWKPLSLPDEEKPSAPTQPVPQARIVIDGIEYVPRAEIPALTDERLRQALEELVAIQYFREPHKAIAQAWNVLNALAPELAQLAAENPRAAFERIWGTGDATG